MDWLIIYLLIGGEGFVDHSESLDLTIVLISSTFDSGQRKATVLVGSLYLGLAPAFLRVPPLVSFFTFFIFVGMLHLLHLLKLVYHK